MKTSTTGVKLPKGYESKLDLMATEIAIKKVKDYFQQILADKLDLTRVSAPLFVRPESGLNDDLNGFERPVAFDVAHTKQDVQIIHSLAKWKRMALHRYKFGMGKGLYTDMNAIRRDEELDSIHSIYVDQWDWEKIMAKEERTESYLKETVERIYMAFKELELYVQSEYPHIKPMLPEKITFVTTYELEEQYPDLTPKQRERAIAEAHKAVFIMKIGDKLPSGEKHDGRAPDYDDWQLNGDIIFWNPVHKDALELSSMGIRVDEEALAYQLEAEGCEDRKSLEFHKLLLDGKLPYTIGGGIGQSRICMYFLQKAHIGEVQASIWPDEMIEECRSHGIELL